VFKRIASAGKTNTMATTPLSRSFLEKAPVVLLFKIVHTALINNNCRLFLSPKIIRKVHSFIEVYIYCGVFESNLIGLGA
jgi:predicted protein tyrosine phosphatase